MKKTILLLLLCLPLAASAQNSDEKYVLVYHHGGSLDAFPETVFADGQYANGQYRLTTSNDTTFCYDEQHIDSIAIRTQAELDSRLPRITQFKLNNKYNYQVFTDVVADIEGDSLITAQVGAIGKWLTPSIQVSDDSARLYIGRQLQLSKQSRRSFADDQTYTVALPRQRVYRNTLVKEAVWGDDVDEFIVTPIALAASMFSSNLPGQDGEGFAQMLDGNTDTFFHSTWNVSQEEKENYVYQTDPYLDIALLEAERRISFSYTTRNADGYAPLAITLYASHDGTQWKQIRTFTADDDQLPTGKAQTYESPIIDLGQPYSHLRLLLTKSSRRRYLVFSEFRLWRAAENPDYHNGEPLQPAEWAYQLQPFGRPYRVHIDWLADRATAVPRIDITTDGGQMVSSKDYYLDATITIDGQGVFPSMPETPVQIKGRGNSSWSNWAWDKNPYRLKFAEKQKPLGLTKGKSWVLLANKQSGSMTTNAIGMKAASLIGTAAANHIVPVDLYLNGQYRGSYNLTEKVGLANNSVDLDDESAAALLELDTYFDETYRFRSNPYGLPVNIKEPDFADPDTHITQRTVEDSFNQFLQTLSQGGDPARHADLDQLARYLLLNDLILNHELKHPKSTYLYREQHGNPESRYIFGPVWDLDWAFGYENHRSYFLGEQTANYYNTTPMESSQFISDLRYVSTQLDRIYSRLIRRFLHGTQLQELLDYCDSYYAYAQPSLRQNANLWGDGTTYDRTTQNAKQWLARRAQRILEQTTDYGDDNSEFEIPNSDDPDLLRPGDADGIENSEFRISNSDGSLADVYDLQGRLVRRRANVFQLRQNLPPGIYIVRGKKMVIR